MKTEGLAETIKGLQRVRCNSTTCQTEPGSERTFGDVVKTVIPGFRSSSSYLWTAVLLTVLLLSACTARNRLLASWVDPAVAGTGQKVEDTLVIGVARDATIRRLFENSFARGLQGQGVRSFTGHTVAAVEKTINYDSVVQAATDTGAKTVLITRLVDVRQSSSTGDSVGRVYGVLKDAPMEAGMLTSSTTQVTSTTTQVKLHLESLLYDVKTRKLLWSARSEVTDPVMTNRFIDTATELYIADLKQNGLL